MVLRFKLRLYPLYFLDFVAHNIHCSHLLPVVKRVPELPPRVRLFGRHILLAQLFQLINRALVSVFVKGEVSPLINCFVWLC